MRKITPMILVTLLLVSALSSFDFAELEETEVIEDAGARAGADAELVAITNPKETVCPTGGCMPQRLESRRCNSHSPLTSKIPWRC